MSFYAMASEIAGSAADDSPRRLLGPRAIETATP